MKIKAVKVFLATGNRIMVGYEPNSFDDIWEEIEFDLPPEIKVVGENEYGERLFGTDSSEHVWALRDLIGYPHPTENKLYVHVPDRNGIKKVTVPYTVADAR